MRSLRRSPAKHIDLLPQDQVFRFQRCSRLEARSQDTENQPEQIGHQDASLRRPLAASTPNRIFGTHSDAHPEFDQVAVDARRPPKQTLRAHLPDQRTQSDLDSRATSSPPRFPTPIATKAGPVPTHQRLRMDNRHDLQNRRKPSIHLDEDPAVVICEPSPAFQLTPQDDQLMSENRILRLKPALRLEWQGQHGQDETEQPDHSTSLGDSITSSTRIRFSVTAQKSG